MKHGLCDVSGASFEDTVDRYRLNGITMSTHITKSEAEDMFNKYMAECDSRMLQNVPHRMSAVPPPVSTWALPKLNVSRSDIEQKRRDEIKRRKVPDDDDIKSESGRAWKKITDIRDGVASLLNAATADPLFIDSPWNLSSIHPDMPKADKYQTVLEREKEEGDDEDMFPIPPVDD
jgi:hypothetical protein